MVRRSFRFRLVYLTATPCATIPTSLVDHTKIILAEALVDDLVRGLIEAMTTAMNRHDHSNH